MSRQHTASRLRENANEAESSAILHQKHAIHFVLKLVSFQKVEPQRRNRFFIMAVSGPFYRSRVFMRINIRMSFDCMHFACFFCFVFFAFTLKKISEVIGLNRLM